jgi:N-acetylneuraminic acid mutarotase
MKRGTNKFLITVFVLLLAFSVVATPFLAIEKVNAENGGSWTNLAPLPLRQFISNTDVAAYTGTTVLNGKIYYIDLNMTLRYDPETNNWTQLAPLPVYNGWGTLVACQNKIYVIGDPTQVYDPTTDSWENRAPLPSIIMEMQANVVDNKIYVISGQPLAGLGIVNPLNTNYVYDPIMDSWSEMAPIPVPVMGYASAVVDNKIYIISGGHEGGPDYEPINLVQIFDPATNQWTNGTSIPIAVSSAGACATTGVSFPKRIYVLGGADNYYYHHSQQGYDFNQVYDPETDTWTNATALPTPRKGFNAVVINDEIYAIGGSDRDIYFTVNEKYTPSGYIPELPSWLLLPLILIGTIVVTFYRRKLTRSSKIN